MKRTITGDDDHKMKRIKHDDDVVKREEEEEDKEVKETGFTNPNSTTMKRTIVGPPATGDDDHKMERIKHDDDVVKREEEEEKEVKETGFTNLHESLLFEVLKHVDAKTLATAGCVSKQWHKTAQDERLWELICTRHWANFGCGYKQLRSVVLALGGFRRLHSLFLWQLSRPPGSGSNWSPLPMIGSKSSARWGRDEVHLSLSLLSIRFYEDMNSSKRN